MSMSRDYNPFANQNIHVPSAYHEDLRRYSSTFGTGDGTPTNIESVPFKRYIDFWILAAALGASQAHFVSVDPTERRFFVTGVVFQRDLPAIEFLFLLSIAHVQDPFVVRDARKVLDIAEGYAAAGIPLVKEMMEDGHLPELQNLTRGLVRMLLSTDS